MFALRVGFAVGVALLVGAGVASAQEGAGAKLFAEKKCTMCHSIAGVGNKKLTLDGVGAKYTADQIREWLVSPAEAAKKHKSTGKPMHGKLTPAEVDALVDYLKGLKK